MQPQSDVLHQVDVQAKKQGQRQEQGHPSSSSSFEVNFGTTGLNFGSDQGLSYRTVLNSQPSLRELINGEEGENNGHRNGPILKRPDETGRNGHSSSSNQLKERSSKGYDARKDRNNVNTEEELELDSLVCLVNLDNQINLAA